MNAAVSLDGRLAPASRTKVRLGSRRDRARMDRLRASADAILVGAGTIRAEDPPLQVRSQVLRRARAREGRSPHLLEIVLSRSLRLPPRARFMTPGPAPRLLVVPRVAPVRRRQALGDAFAIEVCGEREVNIVRLLDRLARRGVGRLLVEGGGGTFARFLRRELVDEIHVTVCPVLLGGIGAPTLFDGEGFETSPFPRMRLELCRREGQEVYLRYGRPLSP